MHTKTVAEQRWVIDIIFKTPTARVHIDQRIVASLHVRRMGCRFIVFFLAPGMKDLIELSIMVSIRSQLHKYHLFLFTSVWSIFISFVTHGFWCYPSVPEKYIFHTKDTQSPPLFFSVWPFTSSIKSIQKTVTFGRFLSPQQWDISRTFGDTSKTGFSGDCKIIYLGKGVNSRYVQYFHDNLFLSYCKFIGVDVSS